MVFQDSAVFLPRLHTGNAYRLGAHRRKTGRSASVQYRVRVLYPAVARITRAGGIHSARTARRYVQNLASRRQKPYSGIYRQSPRLLFSDNAYFLLLPCAYRADERGRYFALQARTQRLRILYEIRFGGLRLLYRPFLRTSRRSLPVPQSPRIGRFGIRTFHHRLYPLVLWNARTYRRPHRPEPSHSAAHDLSPLLRRGPLLHPHDRPSHPARQRRRIVHRIKKELQISPTSDTFPQGLYFLSLPRRVCANIPAQSTLRIIISCYVLTIPPSGEAYAPLVIDKHTPRCQS